MWEALTLMRWYIIISFNFARAVLKATIHSSLSSFAKFLIGDMIGIWAPLWIITQLLKNVFSFDTLTVSNKLLLTSVVQQKVCTPLTFNSSGFESFPGHFKTLHLSIKFGFFYCYPFPGINGPLGTRGSNSLDWGVYHRVGYHGLFM